MSEVIDEQYHAVTCCKCGVKFWLPAAIQEVALIRREEFWFWCPNGHSQSYLPSEPDDGDDGGDGEQIESEVVRFPVITGGKP